MALQALTIGSPNTSQDPKIKENFETLSGLLGGSNKITGTGIEAAAEIGAGQLAASAKPFDWYTPKIIATEQTRENTSFGTLTTADEIASVVLPENGVMLVSYDATVKSSVSGAGRVALFLGANQLKSDQAGTAPAVQEAEVGGTNFRHLVSGQLGLSVASTATWGGNVTTGQIMGLGGVTPFSGGLMAIFAAAGTYAVSAQYKATSGSVTAKERKLWVAVLGV